MQKITEKDVFEDLIIDNITDIAELFHKIIHNKMEISNYTELFYTTSVLKKQLKQIEGSQAKIKDKGIQPTID